MKSLILIESPFQLLGAIEAQNKFELNDVILIIKYTNNPKTNMQIDWVLSKFNFTKVIKLTKFKTITLNDFILAILLFKWKISRKEFDYIIIGESRSLIMRCFAVNLKHNSMYFLDDGSETIVIQKNIVNGIHNYNIEKKNVLQKIRDLFLKLLIIKTDFNLAPNFLTCFILEPVTGQKIVNHSFEKIQTFLKNGNEIKNELHTAHFIGSCLSEVNLMSEDDEINLLKKVFIYLEKTNKYIIYYCHRRESEKKLKRIKSLSHNIKLYKPEYPIELEFLIKSMQIVHLSSFASTALHTVTEIFAPSKSIMFKIPKEILSTRFQKENKELEDNFLLSGKIRLEKDYL